MRTVVNSRNDHTDEELAFIEKRTAENKEYMIKKGYRKPDPAKYKMRP